MPPYVTLEKNFFISPNPLSAHKTSNYLFYLYGYQRARKKGFDEILFCNPEHEIIEGATTNIFCFLNKKWITPPSDQGPLMGVGRHLLIELIKKNRLTIEEKKITETDLKKAQAIILTNAVYGPIYVHSLENKKSENNEGLEAAKLLNKLWHQEVKQRKRN